MHQPGLPLVKEHTDIRKGHAVYGPFKTALDDRSHFIPGWLFVGLERAGASAGFLADTPDQWRGASPRLMASPWPARTP
jgi:hypothetical protein